MLYQNEAVTVRSNSAIASWMAHSSCEFNFRLLYEYENIKYEIDLCTIIMDDEKQNLQSKLKFNY